MKAFSITAKTHSHRYQISAIARSSIHAWAIAFDLFGLCTITVFPKRRSNARHRR